MGFRRPAVYRFGLVLASLPLMAACAANFDAQTEQQYQPAAGISNRDGAVYVIDAQVVTDSSGTGPGTFAATLIDQAPAADGLVSLAATGSTGSTGSTIKATSLSTPIALPSQKAVNLAVTGPIRLTGGGLAAGQFISVTLTFEQAAPLTMEIPVVVGGPGTIYSDVPVGPVTASSS